MHDIILYLYSVFLVTLLIHHEDAVTVKQVKYNAVYNY